MKNSQKASEVKSTMKKIVDCKYLEYLQMIYINRIYDSITPFSQPKNENQLLPFSGNNICIFASTKHFLKFFDFEFPLSLLNNC